MQPQMQVIQGDITTLTVDVIVNAANSSLLGGGGVDGAIHRAAGPSLLEDCKRVRQQQGECVWRGGSEHEERLLEDAYRNSLRLADDNNFTSIAFPAISTGIYGYPKAAAAEIAVNTVAAYLRGYTRLEKVIFVCFDSDNAALYQRLLAQRGTPTGE